MIKPGDTLENPTTGERMTFIRTARETNGDHVLIELVAEPDAFVAAAHVHPAQTETFEVLEGTLSVRIDKTELQAGPGDVVVVGPGRAHKWWNAGDDRLVFRCQIRPALQFESLIETMFGLAADGKCNRKGMPNPLRLAVIANAHLDTVVLPFPPVWLQKAALMVGSPLGRLAGFAPTYTRRTELATTVPATA
jgi:quercetin dioxygenase-like cupin family protein